MNALKVMAIGLVLAGVLALVYGGFSYTKDTTEVKMGPVQLSVQQRKTVNVPIWAGVGALLVGGLLLVTAGKRK